MVFMRWRCEGEDWGRENVLLGRVCVDLVGGSGRWKKGEKSSEMID